MAIALPVMLAAGWMPVRALLGTPGAEAVINARLITLRAPIEGDIAEVPGAPPVGTRLAPGQLLLRILNRRADRTRLDALRRLIVRLEGERNALIARRDGLKALHAELTEQALLFKDGRARQRKAPVAGLRSAMAAAEAAGKATGDEARGDEPAGMLERSEQLSATGATVALDNTRRDAAVAGKAQAMPGHRAAAVHGGRPALRRGAFVADRYDNRRRSAQRADEVARRLSEVIGDIDKHEARLAGLRSDLGEEIERHSRLASAELIAPVRSTVGEILTTPGEAVVRGQDLVRLLDCSGLVATATVGETAYNRLRVGEPARFRFRGESIDYPGRIIALTGLAAPANLAIQPAALAREAYRVTVALPSLVTTEPCAVGRTGRLTFGE
jgi:multidrug resistance efflux pump